MIDHIDCGCKWLLQKIFRMKFCIYYAKVYHIMQQVHSVRLPMSTPESEGGEAVTFSSEGHVDMMYIGHLPHLVFYSLCRRSKAIACEIDSHFRLSIWFASAKTAQSETYLLFAFHVLFLKHNIHFHSQEGTAFCKYALFPCKDVSLLMKKWKMMGIY